MRMHVEELKNEKEWETFLQASPKGTFFHSLKWKEVIEKSFSYPAIYLVVRDTNGAVVGVCPGFVLKSGPLKMYVSMPHSDYGGPVIDKNCIQKASLSLRSFIKGFCSDRGIAYAKIRFTGDQLGRFFQSPLGYVDTSTGTMEIDLKVTPSDFIWDKIFKKKQRKKFRHYEREGLHIRKATTKSDLIEFYNLYHCNMKHIHARAHPYSFFENMWNQLFPENFLVLLVEEKKVIGGSASFKYGQKIYETYAAINRHWSNIRRYSVQPYVSWKLIKWAEENGFRYLSLGGTPSDPVEEYHSQKIDVGGSFVQQERISIPFSYNAQFFLFGLKQVTSMWRTIGSYLPASFKNLMRVYAGEFLA